MKILLKTSGGFANLRIEGELDTGRLPPELAERIESGLASDALRKAATLASPELADGTVYELTILPETEDGERRHFVIDDAAVADEILDVIDEILHEIVRRRRDQARPRGDGDG
ncbi:MAG: protealysin inhibitor emfourin [Thermoanaerobaculia bacterium]